MRNLLNIFLCALLAGCASQKIVRSKYTDKNLRVCLADNSLDANNYTRLEQALVKNGTFVVVARANGLDAIRREQDMLHHASSERFEDKEKWALWGKLYGCGAIITGQTQCYRRAHTWDPSKSINHCGQFISILDANTGEIRASAEAENEAAATFDYYSQLAPDWEEAVDNLVSAYPKFFETESYAKSLENYRDLAGVESRREKERQANKTGPALPDHE